MKLPSFIKNIFHKPFFIRLATAYIVNDILDRLNLDIKNKNEIIAQKNTVIEDYSKIIDERNSLLKEKEETIILKNTVIEDYSKTIYERNSLLKEKEEIITRKNTVIEDYRKTINERNSLLKEKEEIITRKNTVIEDYRKTIHERNSLLKEKEEIIIQKNTILEDCRKTINERNSLLKEKEEIITRKNTLIEDYRKTINERNSLLKEKEEIIIRKNTLIEDCRETISERDSLLKEKNEIIVQKNIVEKDYHTTISEQDSLLKEKEDALNHYSRLASWSQSGEDKIIGFCLQTFCGLASLDSLSYIDVGGNDPERDNNTRFLYRRKGKGVIIEPNQMLVNKFRQCRPRDIVLEAGISFDSSTGSAPYYAFDNDHNGLNTFSTERAEHIRINKHLQYETMEKKLVSLQSVFDDYFPSQKVHLLSIDVEGLEMEILKTIDLRKYRPYLLCLESDQQDFSPYAKHPLIDYLSELDYILVANSSINYIFIAKECFSTKTFVWSC